jgi:osmoprotectant transport system permease protein
LGQGAREAAASPLAAPAGLVALAALVGLPLLLAARNRLLPGAPVPTTAGALALIGLPALAATAAAALAARRPSPAAAWVALLAALLALAALASDLTSGAARALADLPPSGRAFVGPGTWLCGGALAVVALTVARGLRGGGLVLLVGCGALVAAVWAGAFDALSLAVEYRARAEAVNGAVLTHLALAGAALGLALALAVPLGLVAFRGGRLGGLVEVLAGGIQVVPTIALFGVLVSVLAALLRAAPALRDLGLAAVGPAPAVVGVAAYLLLPLVRSLVAGLRAPDPAVIDSARAMGMTAPAILARVRLPLGAPLLVGGLRVAAVQAVGLTVLGGLIGAGGLGAVVFEGMAQFAPDLILLGAAPVVAISVTLDVALRAAGRWPALAGEAR